MNDLRLAIIEDDVLVQESLKAFFNIQSHIDCVLITSSVEDFLKNVDLHILQPSILILDINLLGMSGIKGIPLITKKLPDIDIIMLTTFEDSDSIFKALCAGACSYLSKRTPLKKILEAVEVVHKGGSYMSPSIARKIANHFAPNTSKKGLLTARQKEIVTELVDGKSYKMIADNLFISLDTVRSHIKNIYKVLEINSKAELIKKSYDNEI
ncbi:response regulator transcription factor [Polaribacter glomeratus]|uniref:DNA-binding response regulator n=1 Tax=Polaribacter glomeratus TaxID=102 RepID=A0A2S7WV54_9FLAO|nr:response regulator transcription factor [Polaribacter glomeratus]PQJ81475.1 DNA-binding response regulator [Polaribacter glomeratus]TXD64722.1 response regulator transcription factor [Polaribacter glomeratus]